jgi:hypothetical protein
MFIWRKSFLAKKAKKSLKFVKNMYFLANVKELESSSHDLSTRLTTTAYNLRCARMGEVIELQETISRIVHAAGK